MNRLFLFFLICFTSLTSIATESQKVNYLPEIGGVIRARWEIEPSDGYNRFAVRNARVNIKGNVASPISYFVQADLCNQGKFQFLDAWIRCEIIKGMKVRAGQFRIPFGVDPFRAPGTYIFANRSFIGRYIDNIRAIGLEVSYSPKLIPITLQAGVFNSGPINEKPQWTKEMTFASKAVYNVGPLSVAAGYQTIYPDSIRTNMFDGGVTFAHDRFTAEIEYMYKHYTNQAFRPCHAYNAWVDYMLPLKKCLFNALSFQGRLDGMTAHSDGTRNEEGFLTENHPFRNRITVGSSLAYIKKKLKCELQLNYEKYLYHHGYDAGQGMRDKITAEIIVKF